MMEVPEETPVTTPVEPMVATDVAVELQVPPVVVDESVVLFPTHIVSAPVIAAGRFTTVSDLVYRQPLVSV